MHYLFAAMLLLASAASASDLARESRLAEQIVDGIVEGEPLWLQAEGQRFLAIGTAPPGDARGAVLILHGRGLHPDSELVANPLRTGLAEAGWYTLSIQMPVLEKDAKYYDYVPLFPEARLRIDAALNQLRALGYARPVLIAHSCGAHMAMDWIDHRGEERIGAYVGIGMGATDYRQPMIKPFPLERMRVAVLDVYGSEDYPAVQRMAAQRLHAIRRGGHASSSQMVIDHADHYMHGHDDALLTSVVEWLDSVAP